MNMMVDLMSTASNHYGDEFTKIIKAISSIISESYITRLTVTVTDVNRSETYHSVVAKPHKDGCFYFKDGIKFPLHIWRSSFLNATFNIENDIFSDGKEVNVNAYVRSSDEVDVENIKAISIDAATKPKVIDTTKPIPTDDVRQLIDAAMDRDDKEIYIYISKDATTITISPKRDELTTCKETLCENAHKVMAQEHFEKLIREFVFRDKKGDTSNAKEHQMYSDNGFGL